MSIVDQSTRAALFPRNLAISISEAALGPHRGAQRGVPDSGGKNQELGALK